MPTKRSRREKIALFEITPETINQLSDSKYHIIRRNFAENFLKDGHLYLRNPSKWDDPFEEYWYKLFTKNNPVSRFSMYGFCMSDEYRSDALWRIYSPEKDGVRIKINLRKFCEAVLDADNFNGRLFVGHVEYLSDSKLVKLAEDIRSENHRGLTNTIRPWYTKRTAFTHEKEVRLIYLSSEPQVDGCTLRLPNHMNFVETLLIEPRMPEKDASSYKRDLKAWSKLEESKINQSRLYKLPEKLRKLIE